MGETRMPNITEEEFRFRACDVEGCTEYTRGLYDTMCDGHCKEQRNSHRFDLRFNLCAFSSCKTLVRGKIWCSKHESITSRLSELKLTVDPTIVDPTIIDTDSSPARTLFRQLETRARTDPSIPVEICYKCERGYEGEGTTESITFRLLGNGRGL